jgi:hypothetical protein
MDELSRLEALASKHGSLGFGGKNSLNRLILKRTIHGLLIIYILKTIENLQNLRFTMSMCNAVLTPCSWKR